MTVSFPRPAGVAGYLVYRSSTSTGAFALLTSTTGTSASVAATSGVTYWYRVSARDVAGNESVPSAVVQATAR
jgi:hypothetical protein